MKLRQPKLNEKDKAYLLTELRRETNKLIRKRNAVTDCNIGTLMGLNKKFGASW